MIMIIDVLWPILCTWQAKWAEQPSKVMKQSQRWNTIQVCPPWDSNSDGSDLCSNALPAKEVPTNIESPIIQDVYLVDLRVNTSKYILWALPITHKNTGLFTNNHGYGEKQLIHI